MAIKLQEVKILPELLMKQKLNSAAEKYSKYVGCDILVIYSKSKDSPFETYESKDYRFLFRTMFYFSGNEKENWGREI